MDTVIDTDNDNTENDTNNDMDNLDNNLDTDNTDNINPRKKQAPKNTREEQENKLSKIKSKITLNRQCKHCNTELIKGINVVNNISVMCMECLFSKWYKSTDNEDGIKCNCCKRHKDKQEFIVEKVYKLCQHCRNYNKKEDNITPEENSSKEAYIKMFISFLEILFSKIKEKELNTLNNLKDLIKDEFYKNI